MIIWLDFGNFGTDLLRHLLPLFTMIQLKEIQDAKATFWQREREPMLHKTNYDIDLTIKFVRSITYCKKS